MPLQIQSKGNQGQKRQASRKEPLWDVPGYRPQIYQLAQGYYCHPSPPQLFAKNGQCSNLIIGNPHARVYWPGPIDISTLALPLRQTIHLLSSEIEVYLADRFKPPRGKELNRTCFATFQHRKQINAQKLEMICRGNNTTLLACNQQQFTVLIPHFTRYLFSGFNNKKATKKPIQAVSTVNLAMGRNKKRQNVDEKSQSSKLFSSVRFEQQATGYRTQVSQPPQPQVGQIFDVLRDLVVNSQGKLYQKQLLLPQHHTAQDQHYLQLQNKNRQLYNYPHYHPQPTNTPALHNFMFSADGQLIEYKNYQKCKKLILVQKNQPKQMNADGYRQLIFSNQALSSKFITKIICNSETNVFLRRELSLYMVLFRDKFCFEFDKNNDYVPKNVKLYVIDENERMEMIKNWLTWVIRQDYKTKALDHLPFKTKTMMALAMRKPGLAVDKLIMDFNWTGATSLASFEDSLARKCFKQSNLASALPQLKMLIKQSIPALQCSQWLLCLGLAAWYFDKQHFSKHIVAIVDNADIYKQVSRETGILFRMFQLYSVKKDAELKLQLYTDQNQSLQLLYSQWIVTNLYNLQPLQKKSLVQNSPNGLLLFKHYKYEVAKRLITHFLEHNPADAIKIINQTRQLSVKQKTVLMKMVEMKQKQIYHKIDYLLSRGELIQALKTCLHSNENNQYISKVIYQLVVQYQVFGAYKQRQVQQLLQLLSTRSQQFADLLLILTFNDSTPTIQQMRRMVAIHDGFTRFNHAFGVKVKGMIVSKLEQSLKNCIDKHKQFISALLLEKNILDRIQQLLPESDIHQYL